MKRHQKHTAMPELKLLFLDAIKKINGWSEDVQPSLYETLVGDEAQSIIDVKETKTELKNNLDKRLKEIQAWSDISQAEFRQLINDEWVVRVRETIFCKVMDAVNNVNITTNDGKKMKHCHATAGCMNKQMTGNRKSSLEQTVKNLITAGIYYSKTWGLRLMLGYGENWTSESGSTKRSRWAWGWVIFEAGDISLDINISADVAEQYIKSKVINANLDDVKSAKYVGIEWWALRRYQRKRPMNRRWSVCRPWMDPGSSRRHQSDRQTNTDRFRKRFLISTA